MNSYIEDTQGPAKLHRDILSRVGSTVFIFNIKDQKLVWSNRELKYPRLKKQDILNEQIAKLEFLVSPALICQLVVSTKENEAFIGVFKLSLDGKYQLFEANLTPYKSKDGVVTDYIGVTNSLPNKLLRNIDIAKRHFQKSTEISEKLASMHISEKLTKREYEVLTLVSQGMTNLEIARELYVSIRTVDTHRTNILAKTNSNSFITLLNGLYKGALGIEIFEPRG